MWTPLRRLGWLLRSLITRPRASVTTEDTPFEGDVATQSPWETIEPLAPLPAEDASARSAEGAEKMDVNVSANYLDQALAPPDGRFSQ